MPRLRSEPLKPLLYLGAFLLAWLILPPIGKRVLTSVLYEFQAPSLAAASHVRDLQAYWSLRTRSRDELLETIRDLSRVNQAHAYQRHENERLREELRRMDRLLDLPEQPRFRYEVARVARRDITAWWEGMVLRKGLNYGIPEGAAVISEFGVVGRVSEVRLYTCVVELVSSPDFRMAANVAGDPRPVTYIGRTQTPMGRPVGLVRDVPPDLEPPPGGGLMLVSSSLGGVFPQGLPIGRVDQLEVGANGLFLRGEVQLNEALRSLREVAILVPDAEGADTAE